MLDALEALIAVSFHASEHLSHVDTQGLMSAVISLFKHLFDTPYTTGGP